MSARRSSAVPAAFLLLGAWVLYTPPALAQLSAGYGVASFQFNLSNPGARSLGMGGAFTARADDATAAYANPAGLSILDRLEVSFEGRTASLRLPLIAAEPVVNGLAFPEPDGSGRATFEGTALATPLGEPDATDSTASFVSVVYPYRRWTFAVYRHQLVDLEATSEPLPLPVVVTGGGEYSWTTVGSTRSRARVDIVGYGLAVTRAFGERFSVGATLVRNEASLEARRSSEIRELGAVDLLGEPEPFDRTITFDNRARGVDSDLTLNLGVQARPGNRWVVGAAYREGASFPLEEVERIEDPSGTIERTLPTTGFRVPDVLSVGAAFEASRDLLVSVEWDRVRYSRLRGVASAPASAQNYSEAVDPERLDRLGRFFVDDADELRAGAELTRWDWRLAPSFRLGIWYDPEHKVRFAPAAGCPGSAETRGGQFTCRVDEARPDEALPPAEVTRLFQGVRDATVARSLELLFPRGEDEIHLTGGFGIVLRDRYQIDAALDYVDGDRWVASLSGIVQF